MLMFVARFMSLACIVGPLLAYHLAAQGFFFGGRGASSINLPTPTAYFGFESNALDHTGTHHWTTNGGTLSFGPGLRGRSASFSQASGVWLTGASGLSTNTGSFEWAIWFRANPATVSGGDVLGWWRANYFAEQFRIALDNDRAQVTTAAGQWYDRSFVHGLRVRPLSGPAAWRVSGIGVVACDAGSIAVAYSPDVTNAPLAAELTAGAGQMYDSTTGTIVAIGPPFSATNVIATYTNVAVATNNYSTASLPYVADGWNLLSFAYNSNTVTLHLNNQTTNGYALGAPVANFTNALQLGKSLVSGLIATFAVDEVAFFSGANLTAHQRATLYNSGYGRTYTNGIGWR